MADDSRRIKCLSPDCTNMILPATVLANSGYCGPCAQARRAEERRKFIVENKSVIDPYVELTDPVDLICAIQRPRKYDPLIEYRTPPEAVENLYAQLTQADAERLMDAAHRALRSNDEDFADLIATSLATLTTRNLDRLLRAFVEQNKFSPPIAFRNAGPDIRDAIIAALSAGSANPNTSLSSLAWIGDDTVAHAYQRWDSNPPVWRRQIFVQPSEYSHVAGWEIVSGGRRMLFHTSVWRLNLWRMPSLATLRFSLPRTELTHVRGAAISSSIW
jgi:hypothetical protein